MVSYTHLDQVTVQRPEHTDDYENYLTISTQ